ncbi:hypothetical protein E2C01_021314 [Portunus trituberculatus]|uniref:Uncharacterized protein n=1 Tax=Portunus trituberculatus TaxID=210409 RepID=A0A5B7E3W7_PORTR|nr:hypothetical protein [Portunus trituberculatus]
MNFILTTAAAQLAKGERERPGIYGQKEILFGVPPISKPTHKETVAPSEEAQPTLRPWTGFEPMRLETPRTPKHAWFHCTTAATP